MEMYSIGIHLWELEMKMLWHVDFYDGPLAGAVLHEGRIHWFRCKDWYPSDKRQFEILALSDEEIAAESDNHALFVKYVGSHCDYDQNNNRCVGLTSPGQEWETFYRLPKLQRPYSKVVAEVSEEELMRPVT